MIDTLSRHGENNKQMKYVEKFRNLSVPRYEKSTEQILEENPARNLPAVLEAYFGGLMVRCVCGNEFEYLQDQVNCKRCTRLFVLSDAEDETQD